MRVTKRRKTDADGLTAARIKKMKRDGGFNLFIDTPIAF